MGEVLDIGGELVLVSQIWFQTFLVQFLLFQLFFFRKFRCIFIGGSFILSHQNVYALLLVIVLQECLGLGLFDESIITFGFLRVRSRRNFGRRGRFVNAL